ASLHLLDARGVGPEREPLLRESVARDLRLGHAVHFDQAHPAVAVDPEPGVIAEMRDLDRRDAGRFDQIEPFLDFDLAVVDLDLDLGHSLRLSMLQCFAAKKCELLPRMGHRPAPTCASNSRRNFLMKLSVGIAAASESTLMVVPIMFVQMLSSLSRSAAVPPPASRR